MKVCDGDVVGGGDLDRLSVNKAILGGHVFRKGVLRRRGASSRCVSKSIGSYVVE